ncbi:MAG: hypothetical protein ACRCSQ_02995 [Bacteroidales bacterium]
MIGIWKLYQLPLLLCAAIIWLIHFAQTDIPVYNGFWWIVLSFSAMTMMISVFLNRFKAKGVNLFFSGFAVVKAIKFFLSLLLLLLLSVYYPDFVSFNCVVVGFLFLVTLVVDTGLLLYFARSYKR